MIVESLLTEYRFNPIGIEALKPRLSWKMVSESQGQRQKAYQVLVADDQDKINKGCGNLWDSGKVESDQSVNVKYEGSRLESGKRYWWNVRVWDKDDRVIESGEPAFWEMGLLRQSDWKAKWISAKDSSPDYVDSPYLRKEFKVGDGIKRARAYICGLGYNELYLNGSKVGDRVLEPAFTRYDKRVLYSVYDITDQMESGVNAAGVILGNGWYNMHTRAVWDFDKAGWRDKPTVICQIKIEYEDGRSELVVTDESWKVSSGPIVFNSIRNGEYYDARLELGDWSCKDYVDSEWSYAQEMKGPKGKLVCQTIEPVRVTETLEAISVTEPQPGVFVFDMGQNIAGWARLKVEGSRDTEIVLRYGERLNDDGTVDQKEISKYVKSGLFQTDKYILQGAGEEIWEPRFVYHGFRYVQLEGFCGVPDKENLQARVVHTDFKPSGSFRCSNELLNKVQQCTLWSYRGNFHGYPTDCPHREKNGWTGDAHLACEQAMYNWDNVSGYEKWINDIEDEQQPAGEIAAIIPTAGWGYEWGNGPAWDSAFIIIPWYCYLYRGDVQILEDHYEGFKKYLDYLTSKAENCILKIGLGDWAPAKSETPIEVTSTAYYYIDAVLISKIAKILGKAEEAEKYSKLANDIRKAYDKEFYNGDGLYSSGTQTALSCAVYNAIVEMSEKQKVIGKLLARIEESDGQLDTGILGAKYLFHALSENDKHDVAYRIATGTKFPSYGYLMENDATTLWEFWHKESYSLNHVMYGDISCWFYQKLAGINPDPDRPGFKHIIFRPMLHKDLDWVKAKHESVYGNIESNWAIDNNKFKLKVVVPVNCTATVYVPSCDSDSLKIKCSDSDLTHFEKFTDNKAIIKIASGTYTFQSSI